MFFYVYSIAVLVWGLHFFFLKEIFNNYFIFEDSEVIVYLNYIYDYQILISIARANYKWDY